LAAGIAAITVSVTAGDVIVPLLATMEVDPGLAAVASPGELLELLKVATPVLEEFYVTALVSVCVDLSL
jgi:hypothetical protein